MNSKVYDDLGNQVQLITINTICPIAYSALAKQIAVNFMNSNGASDDQLLDMLPDNLGATGTGIPTHIFCSRQGYSHELLKQLDYLNSQNLLWICADNHNLQDYSATHLKTFFCTIACDTQSLLDYLNLEVI